VTIITQYNIVICARFQTKCWISGPWQRHSFNFWVCVALALLLKSVSQHCFKCTECHKTNEIAAVYHQRRYFLCGGVLCWFSLPVNSMQWTCSVRTVDFTSIFSFCIVAFLITWFVIYTEFMYLQTTHNSTNYQAANIRACIAFRTTLTKRLHNAREFDATLDYIILRWKMAFSPSRIGYVENVAIHVLKSWGSIASLPDSTPSRVPPRLFRTFSEIRSFSVNAAKLWHHESMTPCWSRYTDLVRT